MEFWYRFSQHSPSLSEVITRNIREMAAVLEWKEVWWSPTHWGGRLLAMRLSFCSWKGKFFHLPSFSENQLQPDNRRWRGNAGQQQDLLLQKIWVMRKEHAWCYTNPARAVVNSQDLMFSDFPLGLPPKLIHSGVNHCLCCL